MFVCERVSFACEKNYIIVVSITCSGVTVMSKTLTPKEYVM